MFETRRARRILKGFVVSAMLGVLGVGALFGALWLEHRSETTLPTPTGSFAVGRAIYDWTDDAKLDTLAPVPGTKREFLVWIWYPSAAGPSVAMDDYIPGQMRAAAGPAGGLLGLLTRDVSKVHGHSTRNSDVSPQQRSYPVVIMRAGASAEVANYSTLAEDLGPTTPRAMTGWHKMESAVSRSLSAARPTDLLSFGLFLSSIPDRPGPHRLPWPHAFRHSIFLRETRNGGVTSASEESTRPQRSSINSWGCAASLWLPEHLRQRSSS